MPHSDADLHSEATGLAKFFVKNFSEPQTVKLRFCPFGPFHTPEGFLKLNPRGFDPTLEYDIKPLYESTVILDILEDAYPEHGRKLLPADPYSKAHVRIWIDFVTTRVMPCFHRFLQSLSDSFDKDRSDFWDTLKQFSGAMNEDSPFFLGKGPSIVDFVVAPWAVRLWVFDHYKGSFKLPKEGEGGVDKKSWKRWRQWLAAIEERRSVNDTISGYEYLLPSNLESLILMPHESES